MTVNTVTKPSDLQDKIDKATAAIEAAKRFVWFVLLLAFVKLKLSVAFSENANSLVTD